MSSSTATISSTNSTMNNNDRKRSISSSIHPSPSPPTAKRHNLSKKNIRRSERNERASRSKQQYRHIDNQSSSSESSRSSSNSNYSFQLKNSNEILSTKKATSIALIVKPTPTTIDQRNLGTNYDSDEDFQRTTKQILTKSTHVVVPSSVMTIVKPPDLSKKSLNLNSNSSTKLVVPSIKMLSNGDGLASALRVPTKIQLTKTLLVSSTKNETNHSPSSTTSLDIPIDITDKQQTIVDYHSSTTLPPTPPPPVIDNTNSNVRTTNEKQENNSSKFHSEILEENHSDEHSNDQMKSKRHSSSLSDWSVPPTSELSPTSLTSSSPDLTQNSTDSFIEFDSRKTIKRRYRSLSSFQSTKTFLKPIKSKSLTRLSNSFDTKFLLIENKRSLTSSPIIKLSSSQRIKKRRRDNEYFILNHKSQTKHLKIEFDNHFIIQNLLNEIIERIILTNNETDNTLKSLLIKPVPHVKQTLAIDIMPNRQTKNLVQNPSSQSLDSTGQNESRSMIMTRKELDELAYLLHANVQRGEYERIDNPAKVEERMREMWSQMSNQKKNSYYKRVIQIYKRPNRDVVITSSSTTIENHSLSSNDAIDNTNSSSISMNPLSIELKRQTSTPLSFHSVPSSTSDESPSKTNIFTDIVNELIKGAKGLDKLSCTQTEFINSIHNFVQSTIDQQNQILINLERQVEKKCSTQLTRASLFWKQKITYFANKHQINSSNESMNELIFIVKYFYLYVLSLNCRKQEIEFESSLIDLLNGNLTFIDQSFCSTILTSIIEDLILRSTLANDYLASQFLILNDIEYSLPFIRNIDLENDLLNKNDSSLTTNPFADFNDLEDYLNRCEHMPATIPSYPIQQAHHPSMYYPTYQPPPQYYYPPPSQSSEMNNYYYNPSTVYPYGQSTTYYHPSAIYNNNNNNEQFKYYYNQQQSLYTYSAQPNSPNDIPSLSNNSSIHRTYRQMNSNIQRTYSNSQQQTATPAVFDTTTVVSPQSPPSSATIDT